MKIFSWTFSELLASASTLSSTDCSCAFPRGSSCDSSKGDLGEEACEGRLPVMAEGPVGVPEEGAELRRRRQTSRTP